MPGRRRTAAACGATPSQEGAEGRGRGPGGDLPSLAVPAPPEPEGPARKPPGIHARQDRLAALTGGPQDAGGTGAATTGASARGAAHGSRPDPARPHRSQAVPG